MKLIVNWIFKRFRDRNPPICPELRPIEKCWANMKRYLRTKVQSAISENGTVRMYSGYMDNLSLKILQSYRNPDNFIVFKY